MKELLPSLSWSGDFLADSNGETHSIFLIKHYRSLSSGALNSLETVFHKACSWSLPTIVLDS